MADKNWQAGGKNSIPAQALVCLLAIAAPCGLARAAAPVREFCAGELYRLRRSQSGLGAADRRHRRRFLPGSDRALDHSARCAGPSARSCAKRIRQFGAEQSQPGRDDDRRAEARSSSATIAISKSTGSAAPEISSAHDRPRTARAAARSAACSTSASRSSASLPAARKASSPNCRTGDRFCSKIFRLPNGGTVGDA